MRRWIVVTGGAGFIGSCLIRHLNDRGIDDIILVDDLGSTEKWKNLRGKRFHEFLTIPGLFDWLKEHRDGVRAIFHLGACSDTTETNASYLLDNNFRYTVTLAKMALEYGIRFVYASSAATYGDGRLGFSDDEDKLESLMPLNMYGFSKHLFDLWALRNGHFKELTGLKYFNVFGPNEWHKGKMASAIVKMVRDAKSKGEIFLFASDDPRYSDGGQIRDFIYVKDVVRMTASFLENEATGIFNVGLGVPSTWNELATAVIEALEIDVKITYFDMPKELIGKYQNFTLADMNKWKKSMLPMPTYSLKESVKDYVRGYLLPELTW